MPPYSSMAQFQEEMRQQLESSMHAELEKLLSTSKGADAEVSATGMILLTKLIIKKKHRTHCDE